MYISFRVFYLRYWERLCCTSCMARGQISWVDISVRIISIFLAFAASYPDMELLLYFILPIKIKWMGLVYGVYILYQLATGNPASRIVIISSLLNFVVFFLSSRNLKPYTPKEQVRKAKFRQQTRPHMTYANGAKHRCAVCGRTELDDSSLEFRFCSKCNGNYEYCQDHLFTHQHVK